MSGLPKNFAKLWKGADGTKYIAPATAPSVGQFLQFGINGTTQGASVDLSGYVPYTGANGNVDIGTYTLTSGGVVTKNATTATSVQIHGTYTSGTSYERLNIKGKSSANFEIGPESGSAGGTLRGLTIGGYAAGTTTIAPWLTFTNTGAATFAGLITGSAGCQIDSQSSPITRLTHPNNYIVMERIASSGRLGYKIKAGGSDRGWIRYYDATVRIEIGGEASVGTSIYAGGALAVDFHPTAGTATFSGTITGRASTTAAGTAPIKLATGVLMTAPQAGAIEYDGTNLYFTDSGGTRRQLQVV